MVLNDFQQLKQVFINKYDERSCLLFTWIKNGMIDYDQFTELRALEKFLHTVDEDNFD